MILNTLFIESLSNFAHGISSAFFIYFGLNLVFFRDTNRPLQVLAICSVCGPCKTSRTLFCMSIP